MVPVDIIQLCYTIGSIHIRAPVIAVNQRRFHSKSRKGISFNNQGLNVKEILDTLDLSTLKPLPKVCP